MDNARIYIVEDSSIIRENLIEALHENAPVEVVGTADDEKSARRLAARPQPRVRPRHHRHLPEERLGPRRAEGDGRDAERAERIVLSNHATPEIRVKCQQLGATKVFDKSNELDEMLGWLNRFARSDRGAAASRS